MNRAIHRGRKVSRLMRMLCSLAAWMGIGVLLTLVGTMAWQGLQSLGPAFFVRTAPEGGMLNGILGSLVMVALAAMMGTPLGILAAVWLSEVGRTTRWAGPVRLSLEVLAGAPSIVVGIMIYVIWVDGMGYSGLAGAAALAVIMLPVVAKTSEEILRLVPDGHREAAYALGADARQVTMQVVLPAAAAGITTGVLLAVARVAGETAPLLFTAGGSSLPITDPTEPMGALPLEIYAAATDPSAARIRQGWAGMLVLVALVTVFNLAVRFATRSRR